MSTFGNQSKALVKRFQIPHQPCQPLRLEDCFNHMYKKCVQSPLEITIVATIYDFISQGDETMIHEG